MPKKKQAAEAGGEDKKSGGSGKKWLIIAGVLLVALGVGGYLTYDKLLGEAETVPPPTAPVQAGEASQAGQAGIVQEMETFLVNLADAGGKRYLKVTMQVGLSSPIVAEEFNSRACEIRDRILMVLSSKEYKDVSSYAGKMLLKKNLITQLNRLLQTGQVTHVYFTEFLVQ